MANQNLGLLTSQIVPLNDYTLTVFDVEDVFEFMLTEDRSIQVLLSDLNVEDDADLVLYQDSNGNGILDSGDQAVDGSLNWNNQDEIIDYAAIAGIYFLQVQAYDFGGNKVISYDLDLSTIYKVGPLGNNHLSFNTYTVDVADPTDVFSFELSSPSTLSLYLHNISDDDDVDLSLYQDSNNNGIFDSADQLIGSSYNSSNNDENIYINLVTGNYFAEVARYAFDSVGSASYDLDIIAASLVDSPQLGILGGELTSVNQASLSANKPTDVYTFELLSDQQIHINLHNISVGDDADITLYRDSNGNGFWDSKDIAVTGSYNWLSSDEIINFAAASGTYFAEIERFADGSEGFLTYDFDIVAVQALGLLDSDGLAVTENTLQAADPNDVFAFELAAEATLDISLSNLSAGDDADLTLFQDSNSNGIFDADDQALAGSYNWGQATENITLEAAPGLYFAEVESYNDGDDDAISYALSLAIADGDDDDGGATPDSVPTTYQPFDVNQVFALNSYADAEHVIYLDFDGHTTTNTDWNVAPFPSSIVTPAYDTDGDTSSFSTDELESIWRIWQRVAEDFSPFEVNVTTALPSEDQLTRTDNADLEWGIRVVIGGDALWFDSSGGVLGVALLNSFNWNSDTPTFVFSDNVAENINEKSTAETISHEVGHTLGLQHDGNDMVEYYQGHGSGETGWAPIMGFSDFQNVTQWSQGEYLNASNPEDDLAIITGQNGFGYRADDYGDSLTDADSLILNGDNVETYGIIEQNTDSDWFAFNSTTGNIALSINAFQEGPNLDILASLYDATGQLIVASNPLGMLSAEIETTLTPGDYFLSVAGTGTGDPNTGYSDYGSLGQYSIEGVIA